MTESADAGKQASLFAEAKRYLARGFTVLTLPFRSKKAFLHHKPDERMTEADIERELDAGPKNIALLLGEPSGDLVDVDQDAPETAALAPVFLPRTDMVSGRDGNPRSHYFYRSVLGSETFTLRPVADGEKVMLLEVRSTGLATVVPPSVHETGEIIKWYVDAEPAEVDGEYLRSCARKLATAAYLARRWPHQGTRNEFALAVSGYLLRGGLRPEEVEQIIGAAAEVGGDDEIAARVATVASTVKAIAEGTHVTGGPRMAEITGDEYLPQALAKWLDFNAADQEGTEVPEGAVADVLLAIAREAGELFHDSDKKAYATVGKERATYAVGSVAFAQWLQREYRQKVGKVPGKTATVAAVQAIEGEAIFGGAEHPVYVRVAALKGVTYIDLGDPEWRAVEITPTGWQVVDDPPVKFRRSPGMLALPVPVTGGKVEDLRRFVNLATDDDFRLFIAVVTAALVAGPYPILILQGEQGSAKTTTAEVFRRLIDPNTAGLRGRLRDERDLMIAAFNGHVIAFDNLSGLPQWLSDALCRVATGAAFGTRALYTDMDEVLIRVMRPIVLNGIDEMSSRGDLLSRALQLLLPAIAPEHRRKQQDVWEEFGAALAGLLGALYDTVAAAMAKLPEVTLTDMPRMADFACWGVAVERALGWPEGSFTEAYEANGDDLGDSAMQASPVALATLLFMDKRTEWSGTPSDLFFLLTAAAQEARVPTWGRTWPQRTNKLSSELMRAQPLLRKHGIEVTRSRHGKGSERRRVITLTRVDMENVITEVPQASADIGPRVPVEAPVGRGTDPADDFADNRVEDEEYDYAGDPAYPVRPDYDEDEEYDYAGDPAYAVRPDDDDGDGYYDPADQPGFEGWNPDPDELSDPNWQYGEEDQ